MRGVPDQVQRRHHRARVKGRREAFLDLSLTLERVVDAGLADDSALDRANQCLNRLPLGIGRGVAQQDDIAAGGSDRLIDAVIPHGSAEEIAEVVHAHLDAGADHVCVQPLGEEGIPRESWTALARVLLS